MLYALLIYSPESADHPAPPDLDAILDRHRALQAETRAAGTFAGSVRLASVKSARTVRRGADGPLVTDGPFAETKEVLAGFYLVECADADEAARHGAQICCRPTDRVELRPVTWRAQ